MTNWNYPSSPSGTDWNGPSEPTITSPENGKIKVNGVEIKVYDDTTVKADISTIKLDLDTAEGDITDLSTDVNTKLGDLTGLQTTNKSSLTSAINENVSLLADITLNAYNFKLPNETDYSLAVQRAIDSIGNAVTNGAEILLPRGEIEWKTPVIIHQKDGLKIKGAGRWATKLKAKSTLQYVDNLTLPDDYSTNAFFIVTKRRVTGGVNGALNPAGADAHAWNLSFEGFSFHGNDYSKTINGIFTHGMAQCSFRDIYGEHLKYGVDFGTGGVYRCKAEHGEWVNCVNGFKNVKGTTFDCSSWGYVSTDEGWELNQCHYSTLTCCAIDHWGLGKYAYTLEGIGIVLNGCGSEKGYGGALNLKGRTAVVFDACNLAAGAIPNADNYNGQNDVTDFGVTDFSVIDTDVRAVFNNTTIRQEYSPTNDINNLTHFPIRVKTGAKVLINLMGEILGATETIFQADLGGRINISDSKYDASYYINADTTVTNNDNFKFPLVNAYSDKYLMALNNEFVIKSDGRYKIDVDLVLTGTNLNYVYLLGTILGSKVLEDNIGTLNTGKNRLHFSVILDNLKATEKLSFVLRTNTDSNVVLKKGSIFTITQL